MVRIHDYGVGVAGDRVIWSEKTAGLCYSSDEQTIERVDPGGCPCTTLSSSPGPCTPLDVDGGRVVASGTNETRILAADGSILLSLPVPVRAAQLDGPRLVLGLPGELRVYDAGTGALLDTWSLPPVAIGHDCDLYGDPQCRRPAPLVLEDAAHGVATYVYGGSVHAVRLADGADAVVAPASDARFTDRGLAYADGARILFVPFERLPLTAG